jgi:hypothetical protein
MKRRTKERKDQQQADDEFLRACLEELDEGNEITIVVPSERDAKRMRRSLARIGRRSTDARGDGEP